MAEKNNSREVIVKSDDGSTKRYAAGSLEEAQAMENAEYITLDPRKKASEITVRIDVDVSEALTGLKAVQREAKKAAQEMKALEQANAQAKDIEVLGVLSYKGVEFEITDIYEKGPNFVSLNLANKEMRDRLRSHS